MGNRNRRTNSKPCLVRWLNGRRQSLLYDRQYLFWAFTMLLDSDVVLLAIVNELDGSGLFGSLGLVGRTAVSDVIVCVAIAVMDGKGVPI